jgi:hypothetical protein
MWSMILNVLSVLLAILQFVGLIFLAGVLVIAYVVWQDKRYTNTVHAIWGATKRLELETGETLCAIERRSAIMQELKYLHRKENRLRPKGVPASNIPPIPTSRTVATEA